MDRKKFLLHGLTLGTFSFLPAQELIGAQLLSNPIDKLVDQNGDFVLQPLPYAESALEPFMDQETVHLHYTFHHGGATKASNKDLLMIKEATDKGDYQYADYWVKKSAHHVSSHILHSIFWTNLSNRKTEPAGELKRRIEKDFGSFDKLKALIAQVSKTVDGNGWGILAYQTYSDKLIVTQCENHEKLIQWGSVPLLVIDVWEHAYYLKHKNKRDQFVDSLFPIINWDNVADRLNNVLQ